MGGKAGGEKRGWVVGSFMEASETHGASLWKGQWVSLELVSLHKERG